MFKGLDCTILLFDTLSKDILAQATYESLMIIKPILDHQSAIVFDQEILTYLNRQSLPSDNELRVAMWKKLHQSPGQ